MFFCEESGKKFNTPSEALTHEYNVNIRNSMKTVCSQDTIFDDVSKFYNIQTEEQLQWFLDNVIGDYKRVRGVFRFCYNNNLYQPELRLTEIVIPSWIGYSYYDGGNSLPSHYFIFNLDMKEEIEKLKKQFGVG